MPVVEPQGGERERTCEKKRDMWTNYICKLSAAGPRSFALPQGKPFD